MKQERLAQGAPVIDLSIGAPDIPPADHILRTLAESVSDPSNYVYPIAEREQLCPAVADWYQRRFSVTLDPCSEIVPLLGSQEGLAHIALAVVNQGDVVLVPDPYYPAFISGPKLAGAEIHYMEQRRENNYLVDVDAIPEAVANRAKLLYVSYPNNPTCAVADDAFFIKLIGFAKKHSIVVLHDHAYSDIVFDGKKSKSFLSYDGAMDVGIEFNSLSKPYGTPGMRVGFCLGNRQICSQLQQLKSNLDYGIFLPIQDAAIAALTGDQRIVEDTCSRYEKRRNILCKGLSGLGWNVPRPQGTLFVWAPIPQHFGSSLEFCKLLLEKTGVLVAPGEAFGRMGQGHVRMALVQNTATLQEAVDAIRRARIF